MSESINKDSMTITAMYMAIGAEGVLKALSPAEYEAISERLGGHIGIMDEIQGLAVKCEERLMELDNENYPGVFDYDVSGYFGQWFAENSAPVQKVALVKLYEMIDAFFAKGEAE